MINLPDQMNLENKALTFPKKFPITSNNSVHTKIPSCILISAVMTSAISSAAAPLVACCLAPSQCNVTTNAIQTTDEAVEASLSGGTAVHNGTNVTLPFETTLIPRTRLIPYVGTTPVFIGWPDLRTGITHSSQISTLVMLILLEWTTVFGINWHKQGI